MIITAVPPRPPGVPSGTTSLRVTTPGTDRRPTKRKTSALVPSLLSASVRTHGCSKDATETTSPHAVVRRPGVSAAMAVALTS